MSDDDGDEKHSRRTVRINICIRRTLILVPHWHTDFPKNAKQSQCGNGAKIKMETS